MVQLYIRDEAASVTRPVKELKGFEKISLESGESNTVTFYITDEQLGFYNNNMDYLVEKGDFTFMVGTNSKDVQSIKYTLNENISKAILGLILGASCGFLPDGM